MGRYFPSYARMRADLGCRERLVFKVRRRNQFEHGIGEKVRVPAVVRTKAHFVAIGLEMLRRDSMPRSEDSALHSCPP